MEHFSRSVGSSRGQSLQITVNVWDQIARTVTLTSHGLKHRALSACDMTRYNTAEQTKYGRKAEEQNGRTKFSDFDLFTSL